MSQVSPTAAPCARSATAHAVVDGRNVHHEMSTAGGRTWTSAATTVRTGTCAGCAQRPQRPPRATILRQAAVRWPQASPAASALRAQVEGRDGVARAQVRLRQGRAKRWRRCPTDGPAGQHDVLSPACRWPGRPSRGRRSAPAGTELSVDAWRRWPAPRGEKATKRTRDVETTRGTAGEAASTGSASEAATMGLSGVAGAVGDPNDPHTAAGPRSGRTSRERHRRRGADGVGRPGPPGRGSPARSDRRRDRARGAGSAARTRTGTRLRPDGHAASAGDGSGGQRGTVARSPR